MEKPQDSKTSTQFARFAEIAEDFFQMKEKDLNYYKICTIFADIVHAKYCIFNLYDNSGGSFVTVAISGPESGQLEASKLFGFNLNQRKWPRDFDREEFIKPNIITPCTIKDLVGTHLSNANADRLTTMFGLGKSYIVKISRNEELIGDFMVIMDHGAEFQNQAQDEAILYTRLIGMFIYQNRTKNQLESSETRIADIFEFLPDATFAIDKNHKVIIWNKAIERMTGIKASKIIGKDNHAYTLPFYGERRPHLIDLLENVNQDIEAKYSNFKRELGYVSGQAFAHNLYDKKGAWIYAKASSLHDADGHIIGAIEIVRDITEQKEIEFQLRNSEENYSNLFNRAPLGYQSLDEDGKFIEVNEAWLSTLGYEKKEVIGKWFGDFLAAGYVEAFRERFPLFIKLGKIHSEFEMKHKNGDLCNIAFEGRIGYKSDGSFEKTHCIIQDITERRKAEERIKESEQTHKALFDFSGVGIGYYTTDGHVISFNQKAIKNMGGTDLDYAGKSIYDFFPKESADVYFARIVKATHSDKPEDYEDCVPLPFGDMWFYSTFTKILDIHGNVKGIQIISQDISELKTKEREITYLSYHDQLTGLYNRRYFDEELSRLDTQRNYPLTLAMGDVNGLKLVNDSFGHKTGDQLLVSVANSIRKACREDDIIARVGGDEFSIIFPKTTEEDAEKIIQRINYYVSQEKIGPLGVSISFGFETKYAEDESIESIIKNTEDHMYRHKLNDSSSLRNKTINLIMSTLFEKNKREMKHSERVSEICVEIATVIGFGKDEINHIRTAGLMHDIGKIGVDEGILNSHTILSNDEWRGIQKHTEIGYRILSSTPEFTDIAEDVYAHHERWDGKGYPRGLKEEAISVSARIITIADAFDAMISERPYRTYKKSMSTEDAVNEIKNNSGTQFDPVLARIFVEKIMHFNW